MYVTREVVLDCSTDEAWELLTDREELAAWLGRPVDFDLDTVEGQRVRFVWSDGDREASEVEFVLERVDDRTRLTVTETPRARASAAGGIRRLPMGARWDDRLLDLELRCLSRTAVFA
ncbi:MAG TPA: hypothetical protein VGZ52_12030 [Acidimicrobiales bacterium]|jgi:uncharacterized protein YndB with AHSA1/START domain|nr:hypothetical protein [Acidimicrobiales bacterium]